MPLPSSLIGIASESIHSTPDARWTMAYAAALGDAVPCYFDTRRSDGVIAHPLFPVCFEWPAFLRIGAALREPSFSLDEARHGVHATHDTIIHRPIRAGDRLSTRAIVAGIERRRPGAYMITRIETFDSSGAPVCTTWYGSLYRGVDVIGEDRQADAPAQPAASPDLAEPQWETAVPIGAGLAHVYSECARIWNPIHTDAAVAAAAGLPAIILHGTATLALAVSQIVEREAQSRPERVTRIAGRFAAMVPMPSEIRVRMLGRRRNADRDAIRFSVLNADGQQAIRDGLVELRSS
jgi:acyl dehydratase